MTPRYAVGFDTLVWVDAEDDDAARENARDTVAALAEDGELGVLEFSIVDVVDEEGES